MLRLLLYLFLLQLLLLSVKILFFLEFSLQHLQPLLYFSLCLRVILLSHHHPVASISKVAFTTSGSTWTCNFAPPLRCQQPSPCICRMQVWYLLLLLMVLLIVMSLPFHLDILVHEQLDVFIDRQVHKHLISYIPSCALNGVFDSALLEAIVPMLLRVKWTLVIPGDIETFITCNLSVEN